MYKILIIIVSTISLSCSSKENKQLHSALKSASNNRVELERMSFYYKDDPFKLEAARFLIRNMPYRNSYSGKAAEKYIINKLIRYYLLY